jgi:hypothetical protein
MATSDINYNVKVQLDATDIPTKNKLVIWSGSAENFALSNESAPTTICTTSDQNVGSKSLVITSLSSANDTILKGELTAKVQDGTRYQISRIIIGWKDNTTSTTNISVVEDVRYPDSKIIYSINSFAATWGGNDTITLTWTQYTMGSTSDQSVDYCLNYITF